MNLTSAILIAVSSIFCAASLSAQRHIEYLNSDPVVSDTHWLVAEVETEVHLRVLPAQNVPTTVEVTSRANCVVISQQRHQVSVNLRIVAPAVGPCHMVLTQYEFDAQHPDQRGPAVARYSVRLEAFVAADDFPSIEDGPEGAFTNSATATYSISAQLRNVVVGAAPASAHLVHGADICVPSPMQIFNQSVVDGLWTAAVRPNTLAWHSLAFDVLLANGSRARLYTSVAFLPNVVGLSAFPRFVPADEEVEVFVMASGIEFADTTKVRIPPGQGELISYLIQPNSIIVTATFSLLPATIIVDVADADRTWWVLLTEETPAQKALKECVKEQLDGKLAKQEEGDECCIVVADGVSWAMIGEHLKPKLADDEVVEVVVEGANGEKIPVVIHNGRSLTPAQPAALPPTPSGQNGTPGDPGTAGTTGANGANGQVPGESGQSGTIGANGDNGADGGNGNNGDWGKEGTQGTKPRLFDVTRGGSCYLLLIFGPDGSKGGNGARGGNAGNGAIGGNGGNGGQGGFGGNGANGNPDPDNPGQFLDFGGNGGNGGAGGNGGNGGQGGNGGTGGLGGRGGKGGIGGSVRFKVPKDVYVVVFLGDGGQGGNSGGGGDKGFQSVGGQGGSVGAGGTRGLGGLGNPDGAAGADGPPGNSGQQGANGADGTPGAGGDGGAGGEPGKHEKSEGGCVVEIVDGVDGQTGVSQPAGN